MCALIACLFCAGLRFIYDTCAVLFFLHVLPSAVCFCSQAITTTKVQKKKKNYDHEDVITTTGELVRSVQWAWTWS